MEGADGGGKLAGAAFAPPPWSYRDNTRWVVDAAGDPIALVRLGAFPPDRVAATGRLIAAAPDLLAALRELIDSAGNPPAETLVRAAEIVARATGAAE